MRDQAPDGGPEPTVLTSARAFLPSSPRDFTATLILAIAYWATATASLSFLAPAPVGVVVWPAAGIALAALVLGGLRLWPGVFLGQLAAAFATQSAPATLVLAAGATLAAVAPAWILHRWKLDRTLCDLRSALWLVVGGAMLGATVSTAGGVLARSVAAPVGLDDLYALRTWWLGVLVGVLVVTPPLVSWGTRLPQRWRARDVAHLAAAVLVVALAAYVIYLLPAPRNGRSWYIMPLLVWPALAFSVRGASLAVGAVALMAFTAAVQHVGPFAAAGDIVVSSVLTQQMMAVMAATVLILAAVADERRGRGQLLATAERLREETEALEVLNRTGAAIAAELDLDAAVQRVTDAGVSLSGAQFGAFFYNVTDEAGDSYMLFALTGAPREAFERFGQPRATKVFAPTFAGEGVVRVDDITRDPRYGQNPPHRGMPKGHLPVKSYLAAPVRSRSGEVIGGLFFGHPKPGVFTERAERLILGIASQAAIAIDNARLYQAAQREIAQRAQAEAHQRLLMNELNHRVKNTLATVQAMGAQTMRTGRSLAEAREAFVSRLMALSAAHNLLTAERWESADLEDVVRMAVAAFDEPAGGRLRVCGPGLRLKAQNALGLAMALHELAANAARYGALGDEGGTVDVTWSQALDGQVKFTWTETGGPAVSAPLRRGFGSRLIQEGLSRELNGQVRMDFLPEGLVCRLSFPLDRTVWTPDPDAEPDEAGADSGV